MAKPLYLLLGQLPLPLDVHDLEVDGEGRIACHPHQRWPITFDFAYRDIPFAVSYDERSGEPRVLLVGRLGPMPYSAESPQARHGLQTIIRAANQVLGPSFRVNADNQILLGRESVLQQKATVVTLLAEVAGFLALATPYLECAAAFLRPPLAAAKPGESRVQPQFRRPQRTFRKQKHPGERT